MIYKLSKLSNSCVQCIEENGLVLLIPFAPDNTDYQAYLAWVEQGNVAQPADEDK
jgi:hypothetical protein